MISNSVLVTAPDKSLWAGVAQSVQPLARAGWSGDRIPVGGEVSPHRSRPALDTTQFPIQWPPGLSPGVRRPGRGVDHPHQAPRLRKE